MPDHDDKQTNNSGYVPEAERPTTPYPTTFPQTHTKVEPAPAEPIVDHIAEIRTLLGELSNDITPSGAQTVAGKIEKHLNVMATAENERKKA